jgi:short-subunit dehydrogenase
MEKEKHNEKSRGKLCRGVRRRRLGRGSLAKEFAAEGAEVILAGRTKDNVDAVTRQITESGGRAQSAVIDAGITLQSTNISMKS